MARGCWSPCPLGAEGACPQEEGAGTAFGARCLCGLYFQNMCTNVTFNQSQGYWLIIL